MTRLGYDRFYVQGGDWGAGISQMMAKLYPRQVGYLLFQNINSTRLEHFYGVMVTRDENLIESLSLVKVLKGF